VVDSAAEPLARFVAGGAVAVAAKKTVDGTSVYAGLLQLPAGLLRSLARRAGVHLYSEDDDVVMAGNGFVAIHASAAGTKTLRLPEPGALTDAVTGEDLPPADSFTFAMQQGDTRLFRVDGSGDQDHLTE
jgi:hypothetical protein